MLDYRKSDLMDDLFKRYLESYELTLETEDVTGMVAYKFVLDKLTRNFKEDIKLLDIELKNYRKFRVKERKHEIKLENLKFYYIDDEEYENLTSIRRFLYNSKRRKYEREMKKFERVVQKYRLYIPSEWYSEEEITDEEIVEEESTVNVAVDPEIETSEEVETTEQTVQEAEKETEEEHQITIEEFFNEMKKGEKEE